MEPTQANKNAETENQQEPMPSLDQTTSASEGADSAAPVVNEEVSQSGQTDDLALPEDVKKRTAEQFDKLKQQLAEERARRMEAEQSAFSAYSQPRQQQEPNPLYDPNTGIVNIDELERLRTTSDSASKRAEQAEKKLERYIAAEQEREAYTVYPELNPKSKDHDDGLYKATRALITDSLMNPKDYGGNELTMREAADIAVSLQNRKIDAVKRETKEQTLKELTPKEQASLDVKGRSDQGSQREDLFDLRDRSRRGDLDAIVARLRDIPSV